MPAVTFGRRLGNKLYKAAFPLYRPLYSSFKSYADRAERRLLANHLSEGCIVVDAGANIGVYSRFLSKCVGPSGLVHSFEPSPENCARLRAAVADLPNVRANPLAVGETTGEQLLYVSSSLNVDHRTYPTQGESRTTARISATALDDYFKPGERVDFIKLDIQGYELHALRGAKRVLLDNPGVQILFEFWPYGLAEAGTSAEELIAFLRSRDFKIFSIGPRGLADFENIPATGTPSIYHNLFARRETFVAKV